MCQHTKMFTRMNSGHVDEAASSNDAKGCTPHSDVLPLSRVVGVDNPLLKNAGLELDATKTQGHTRSCVFSNDPYNPTLCPHHSTRPPRNFHNCLSVIFNRRVASAILPRFFRDSCYGLRCRATTTSYEARSPLTPNWTIRNECVI